MFHWSLATKFPGDGWFDAAWGAVARHYRRRGEGKFISAVEENFLDPTRRGAPMMGWLVLGLTANTNIVERGNRWFRKQISEELHALEARATLPTSLTTLINILRDLWPRWAAAENAHRDYRTPSFYKQRSQREFERELQAPKSKVIKLNGSAGKTTCYAFKQKSLYGPLHPLTKSSALAAAKKWNEGPKPSMPWKSFTTMGEITFTTAHSCFPCWTWGTTGGCYHQDAVRKALGFRPLTDPYQRKPQEKGGRGRKRRTKARFFEADIGSSKHKRSQAK